MLACNNQLRGLPCVVFSITATSGASVECGISTYIDPTRSHHDSSVSNEICNHRLVEDDSTSNTSEPSTPSLSHELHSCHQPSQEQSTPNEFYADLPVAATPLIESSEEIHTYSATSWSIAGTARTETPDEHDHCHWRLPGFAPTMPHRFPRGMVRALSFDSPEGKADERDYAADMDGSTKSSEHYTDVPSVGDFSDKKCACDRCGYSQLTGCLNAPANGSIYCRRCETATCACFCDDPSELDECEMEAALLLSRSETPADEVGAALILESGVFSASQHTFRKCACELCGYSEQVGCLRAAVKASIFCAFCAGPGCGCFCDWPEVDKVREDGASDCERAFVDDNMEITTPPQARAPRVVNLIASRSPSGSSTRELDEERGDATIGYRRHLSLLGKIKFMQDASENGTVDARKVVTSDYAFDSTLGYPGEGHAAKISRPPTPVQDRLWRTELVELMEALDLVALAGIKPSDEMLNCLCRLIVDKIRPEKGSRKAAWAAALWHLQTHIYIQVSMVLKVTEAAPRTFRMYCAGWNEIDWHMLHGLAERAEMAQSLAELGEDTAGPEPSDADWPGPSGLDFSEV